MPVGPRGERRPADFVGCAVMVARLATGETTETPKPPSGKIRSGKAGAEARAKKLTKEQRSAIAKKAAQERWKQKMAYSALTVGKYFLQIPDKDSGELVSNLKLQKLLYYALGHSVALYGVDNPIFKDKIYAWKHGPVVKTVYTHFSIYGDGAIPPDQKPALLDSETKNFLDEIYRVFGRYSAWVLRDMTHKETPWLKNYKPDQKNIEIPLKDIHRYFASYVKKPKSA